MPNPENIKGRGFDVRPENINRGGYPKGQKNRSTLLKKWLDVKTKVKNLETGQDENGTVEDKVILGLLKKAIGGDVNACKEILDTVYGKMPDRLEQTNFNVSFDREDKDA
jgi:hypothetical protein